MFVKQYEDAVLVECYLKHYSQIKAAEDLGCSRETVARAVRRAGITLSGRKNNGGGYRGCGSPEKITDDELVNESRKMTRFEITKKHRMNVCNVDRRLHRLGIACKKASFHRTGETGLSHYRERAIAYGADYDPDITLERIIERDKGICGICGKPVDMADIRGNTIGRYYPTIDHIKPMSKGGGHVWGNVRLAHMICNSRKGDDRC